MSKVEEVLLRFTLKEDGTHYLSGAHVKRQIWVDGPDGNKVLQIGSPKPLGTTDKDLEPILSEALLAAIEAVEQEKGKPKEPSEGGVDSYVVAVQKAMDDWAKTRNYDGILSLCSYATSTIEKFRTEGQRGVEVRDKCWAASYQDLDDVNNNRRPVITPAELVAELEPLFVWP